MPDMDGVFRGKRVPRANFLDGLEGGFAQCDVLFGWDIAEDLIPNLTFTGWDTGWSSIQLKPRPPGVGWGVRAGGPWWRSP
jgi:glutamine synthetase